MKIGIDATPLTLPFNCGVKRYATELLFGIAKIDHKNDYYIFASGKIRVPKQKNFHHVKIPKIPIMKRQLFMPYLAHKKHLDVFHYLEPYGSVLFRHNNIVTTVHDIDLIPTYPIFSKNILRRIYCEVTRRFVFKNTKIFIVPTKNISAELSSFLHSESDKKRINVTYLGVSPTFRKEKKRKKHQGYYLSMGDFAPRKNVSRVINAYVNLPKNIRRNFKLVVIASTSKSAKKFTDLANKMDANGRVVVLVNVSSQKLVELYNNATAFVYPSLYEGFGLPVLEAMSCGCPVITTNYGATKEVSGNAALLVDPRSEDSIKKGMIDIVRNANLRKELILRGIARSRNFKWQITVKQTLSTYRQLLTDNR